MSNLFDVAIGVLIWHELNVKLADEGKKQLQDAQRILEAAGRITHDDYQMVRDRDKASSAVENLVEAAYAALPDKEKP